jgi:hypothetical protein
MLATGRIRNYQMVVGGLQLLNVPLSLLILSLGGMPESVLFVSIGLSHCCLLARLLMLHKMISLDVGLYMRKVYVNVLMVTLVSTLLSLFLNIQMSAGITRLFVMSPGIMLIILLTVFFVGCDSSERTFVIHKVPQLLSSKILHR